MKYDVIVIGGGASGMLCAGRAGERGKKVLLLEKNSDLGEKLKITGNGRCNITNTTPDLNLLLKNYGQAEKFLYSSFVQFGVEATIKFFEDRGLAIVTEEHNRAFPKSQRAVDVVETLIEYLKKNKVTIKTNSQVQKIISAGDKVTGVIVNKQLIEANNVVIATGGTSHPETGSTGDGFRWLSQLGHTIVKPTPAVVPLAIKEKWIKTLSGTTLTDIKISVYVDGVKKFSKQGNVLCTHFGLSGPLILNSSAKVADLLPTGNVTMTLDMFPKMDHKQLDTYLLDQIEQHNNNLLITILKFILPAGTAKVIAGELNVPEGLKANQLTKSQRLNLINNLKGLKLTVTGLMGLDRAVVVDGGLILKEVNNKTFASSKYSNLYITGDVLHIRRPSGGFSLQLCWTSGYVVGNNIS